MVDTISKKFGAGTYTQGVDILGGVGERLALLGKRVFVVGSPTAMEKAFDKIEGGLRENGLDWYHYEFKGECSYAHTDRIINEHVKKYKPDVVLGIGGGKVMDMAKIVANFSHLRVVNVPTVAGTCACYAPLSVMYFDDGTSDHGEKHPCEVEAVFCDLDVIAKSPARYTSSGIVDGYSKYPEGFIVEHELNIDNTTVEVHSSRAIAEVVRDEFYKGAVQAVNDARQNLVTKDLNDQIFNAMVNVGVISGYRSGRVSCPWDLGHCIYDSVRCVYPEAKPYLHGEIVGVGALMQMHMCHFSDDEIDRVKGIYNELGQPTTLHEVGVDLDNTEKRDELVSVMFKRRNYDKKWYKTICEELEKIK